MLKWYSFCLYKSKEVKMQVDKINVSSLKSVLNKSNSHISANFDDVLNQVSSIKLDKFEDIHKVLWQEAEKGNISHHDGFHILASFNNAVLQEAYKKYGMDKMFAHVGEIAQNKLELTQSEQIKSFLKITEKNLIHLHKLTNHEPKEALEKRVSFLEKLIQSV